MQENYTKKYAKEKNIYKKKLKTCTRKYTRKIMHRKISPKKLYKKNTQEKLYR